MYNALIANPMIASTNAFAAPLRYKQEMERNALARYAPPSENALAINHGTNQEGDPRRGMFPTDAEASSGGAQASEKAMRLAGERIGLNEREQNAALREYMANGGQNLDPAVTAWCAAFVNATLKQSGVDGTGSLAARSFENWGQPVTDPREGDIAVFSRGDPNGWQGHVGFFKGYDPDGNILVLGGNQRDSVSISPYSPDRLIGFRRY